MRRQMMTKDLEYYLSFPYKVELEYESSDNTWVASHPDLGRGSCYAVGETKTEALKILEDIKTELIGYLFENKLPIPEPKPEELPSGNFVLRLPKTLHQRLKEKATREGVSLNQYVMHIVSSESRGDELLEKYNHLAKQHIELLIKLQDLTLAFNKHAKDSQMQIFDPLNGQFEGANFIEKDIHGFVCTDDLGEPIRLISGSQNMIKLSPRTMELNSAATTWNN